MNNTLQSVRWARQDALSTLVDMGIPPILLTDLADLARLTYRLGYTYKTPPLQLLIEFGPVRFCRELNQEVRRWWD